MDPLSILAEVKIIVGVAQMAIQVGEETAPLISRLFDLVTNGHGLTDAERADLDARSDRYTAQLEAPQIDADAP